MSIIIKAWDCASKEEDELVFIIFGARHILFKLKLGTSCNNLRLGLSLCRFSQKSEFEEQPINLQPLRKNSMTEKFRID